MKNSAVLATLEAAQKLIADPKGWTYRALARDRWGKVIAINHADAVQFCAVGALYRVTPDAQTLHDCRELLCEVTGRSIECVNDSHGHGAIVKAYADAITAAKGAAE